MKKNVTARAVALSFLFLLTVLIGENLMAQMPRVPQSSDIRPDRFPESLTIAGTTYKIGYRSGGKTTDGNQAIITLDCGDAIKGEGFLISRKGRIQGMANVDGKHYRFTLSDSSADSLANTRSSDGNIETIVEIPKAPHEPTGITDTIRDPEDTKTERVIKKPSSTSPTDPGAPGTTPSAPADGSPVVISIMVLYDQAAVSSLLSLAGLSPQSNMVETIDMAIAQANEVYANCGIDVELVLVHTEAFDYTESGSLTTDLRALSLDTNVAALREQYSADVVTLMEGTSDQTYSGMAYILSGTSKLAFNVVEATYCLNDYVLVHEVGHNLGCAHDRPNAASPGAYGYSYGYNFGPPTSDVGELAYGTIMCYPGSRSGVFSSPSNSYMGYVTGTVSNNNVATVIERAPWIAAIMPQPITIYPAGITLVPGTTLTLKVEGAGVPAPCFQWQHNGTNVYPVTATGNSTGSATSGTASNMLVIPNVTPGNAGSYRCVLSNVFAKTFDCVTSTVANVSIVRGPHVVQPKFISITPDGSGGMSLLYYGAMQTCLIQASGDCVEWKTIATNPPTGQICAFTDTNAGNVPSRFYRLKVLPQ